MDDKTLTALTQSIEKWERNAVAETPVGYTTGAASCALCGLFWMEGCCDCPVMERTGLRGCSGTPHDEATAAGSRWRGYPSDAALRDDAHAAARAEAKFLRSLLPEGEGRP